MSRSNTAAGVLARIVPIMAVACAACGHADVDADASGGAPDASVADVDGNPDLDAGSDSFSLTVTLDGTGSGTVTSSPAGIDCGADCSHDFAADTVVTLTATSEGSSTFGGWSGACSGMDTCVVAMDAAKSVKAAFNPPGSYSLVVSPAGPGSGTVTSDPSGIDCGDDCTEQYIEDTVVTLTASPSTGSTFTGWSGGGCSGTGTCVVTITAATTVTATFALKQYVLTVNKAGAGSGTVTSAPGGINCGSDCQEPYDYGTSVTLTAAASTGSTFDGWSGSGCSGAGTCTVTMTAARSVTATHSVACTDCKTFVTTSVSNGNLGGVAGADARCMADMSHPGSGTYKALIVDGTNRRACTTDNCTGGGSAEHIDWVLHPNTSYYRSDGTTLIMVTDANGIFAFGTLAHSFTAGSGRYWTGLEALGNGWTTTSWHCANWTNGTGDPVAGMTGSGSSTGIASIRVNAPYCDATYRLMCVEQ